MSPKQLVRISNGIGIISILLLIYWVFTFVVINVFGLKVFKENLTETFYMSILGILALMTGALMVNIMFNLTRIAQRSESTEVKAKSNKKVFVILLLIFPLIASLLFFGDYLTKQKKERLMIQAAKSIVENNTQKSDKLLNYTFSKKYINTSKKILALYTQTDTYFPDVSLIVKDEIDGSPVYLAFDSNGLIEENDTIQPMKKDYLRKTTKDEREYLRLVFSRNNNEVRYTSQEGNYELFYPYIKNGKKVVLYFSDYQRYGK